MDFTISLHWTAWGMPPYLKKCHHDYIFRCTVLQLTKKSTNFSSQCKYRREFRFVRPHPNIRRFSTSIDHTKWKKYILWMDCHMQNECLNKNPCVRAFDMRWRPGVKSKTALPQTKQNKTKQTISNDEMEYKTFGTSEQQLMQSIVSRVLTATPFVLFFLEATDWIALTDELTVCVYLYACEMFRHRFVLPASRTHTLTGWLHCAPLIDLHLCAVLLLVCALCSSNDHFFHHTMELNGE